MPYPPQHRDETRRRIVRSARRLFNERGFESVSIDAIMAGANLTRGGFYRYFTTKSDLYAEAMDCFFTNPGCSNCGEGVQAVPPGGELGAQIIRAYLSRQHHQDIEDTCPTVALAGDVRRTGPVIKKAYEHALNALADHLRQDGSDGVRSDRSTALAILALCVGGMIIARASDDLADEVRAAAKGVALALGGWQDLDAQNVPNARS